jgi:hypothetical protein
MGETMIKLVRTGLAGAIAAAALGVSAPAFAACQDRWICVTVDVGVELTLCVKVKVCDSDPTGDSDTIG